MTKYIQVYIKHKIFVNMYQSDDNQDIVRLYTSVKIDFEELIRQNLWYINECKFYKSIQEQWVILLLIYSFISNI